MYLLQNVIRRYTSWKVLRAILHKKEAYKNLGKKLSIQSQIHNNKALWKP